VAREQARLERLEAALPAPAPEPKSEEPKKRAAKKPKSAEPKGEEPKSEDPVVAFFKTTNAKSLFYSVYGTPSAPFDNPTAGMREQMAAVVQLSNANITQLGAGLVQKTTAEFASEAAIPKSLQSALDRFVSKDETYANLLTPFRLGKHLYATDFDRAIRVRVQSTPDKERGVGVDRIFAGAQDNRPTVTLDADTAKSIAAVCRALGPDIPVEIHTEMGKTTFSASGHTFATVDAHVERAREQTVDAKYLADMLSVEQPVTLLQNSDARSWYPPLSAHTASTQQLVMPRRP